MGGCASSEVMPLRCLGPIEAMEAERAERAEVLPQNEVIASVSEVNLQELRAPSAASPCNYEVMSLAKSDCSDLSGRSPSASSTPGSRAGEVRASCREWNRQLRPVALTSPSQTLKVFQSFSVSSTVVDLSWNNIAGCEPLLFEVASFLLQEPEDFSRVMLNTACAWQLRPFLEILWRGMYQQRWPSFYECLACHQAKAWCAIYWQTLRGQIDFPLEIYEREKKLGFSMSVMPARVYYDQHQCAYVATYVSASNVRPESIPISEEHRLRFCPGSAAQRLEIEPLWSESSSGSPSPQVPRMLRNRYPYQVLEGLQGLEVGQPAELQWKMQLASPFGWWHCHLEALRPDETGTPAWAKVIFKHFSPRSRWYRLHVHVGQRVVKRCDFGGFTGGLRRVNEMEEKQWMQFFPRKVLDV